MSDILISNRLNKPRTRYEIRVERYPSVPPVYKAVDLVTFDDEPGSTYHCEGYGEDVTEAVADLLRQLAELSLLEVAMAPDYASNNLTLRAGSVSPDEPVRQQEQDPDYE